MQLGDQVTGYKASDALCKHNHKIHQLVPLPLVPGNYVSRAHQGCKINEEIALRERHALPYLKHPDQPQLYEDVARHFRKIFRPVQITPLTVEELLQAVPPSRRKRVAQAMKELDETGWLKVYEMAEAFVKFDKGEGPSPFELQGEQNDKGKMDAPRLIQFVSMVMCYSYMRFLKPIEHEVYPRRPVKGFKYARKVPVYKRDFIKGMNANEVARNLRWKTEQFRDPAFVLLDHSRFDSHLNWKMQEELSMNYNKACTAAPNEDNRFFHYLINCLRKVRVNAKSGAHWVIDGSMLSGRPDTSYTDNMVNYQAILYWLDKVCKVTKAERMVNGDDSIVIVERSELHKLDFEWFKLFGLRTKVEIVYDMRQADFCQTKYVDTLKGPKMVRDPFRLMSRCCYTIKGGLHKDGPYSLLGAIAAGELHCNAGVPVLQSFALMLRRAARGHFSQALLDEYMARRGSMEFVKPYEVSDQARIDFWIAHGIDPLEQRELERWFDSADLPMTYFDT